MHEWFGFFLVAVGGCANGVFYLPVKYVNPWKWENIWTLWAFIALIAIPSSVAFATVPRLGEALGSVPLGAMLRVFLFGVGWGVGAVLAGLGAARMGMAMGFAIVIGVSAALGTLVPLVVSTPEMVFRAKGLMIILSVLTFLVGVAVVAVAGRKRADSQGSGSDPLQEGRFISGLTICILSGVFSSMMNFAFAFSRAISQAALRMGATHSGALNVVWMITLAGGFIPNGLYTSYLLTRNRTWGHYFLPRTALFWLFGLYMGVVWTSGLILYGRGASVLGELGPAIGWPVSMASLILGSSAVGFVTGEWRGASTQARRLIVSGLGVLVLALGLLGIAKRL